jgi:hypothetical protein
MRESVQDGWLTSHKPTAVHQGNVGIDEEIWQGLFNDISPYWETDLKSRWRLLYMSLHGDIIIGHPTGGVSRRMKRTAPSKKENAGRISNT